jgi:hypothetical protein
MPPGYANHVRPVPAPQGAAQAARDDHVRRGTTDAGDRPGADEPSKLLLLDEPSLGLAPIVVKQIFQTLRELARGMTIFLVEQNAHTR